MRQDLIQKLITKYPNLYRDFVNAKGPRGYMSVGNGWFPLINDLSSKLEKMILKLPENKQKYYKATQIKQKWGGLRYYMNDRTAEMRIVMEDAERESWITCEVCGKPGKLNQQVMGKWVTVSCKDHTELTSLRDIEPVDINWLVKISSTIARLVY